MQTDTLDRRIVLLGDWGVGKTALAVRLNENTADVFVEIHVSTDAGLEFFGVKFEDHHCTVWDGINLDCAKSCDAAFRDSAIYLLLFDPTNDDSLTYLTEIREVFARYDRIIVVCNKTDLKGAKMILQIHAREFAKNVGAEYVEISVKHNALDPLREACRAIWEGFDPPQPVQRTNEGFQLMPNLAAPMTSDEEAQRSNADELTDTHGNFQNAIGARQHANELTVPLSAPSREQEEFQIDNQDKIQRAQQIGQQTGVERRDKYYVGQRQQREHVNSNESHTSQPQYLPRKQQEQQELRGFQHAPRYEQQTQASGNRLQYANNMCVQHANGSNYLNQQEAHFQQSEMEYQEKLQRLQLQLQHQHQQPQQQERHQLQQQLQNQEEWHQHEQKQQQLQQQLQQQEQYQLQQEEQELQRQDEFHEQQRQQQLELQRQEVFHQQQQRQQQQELQHQKESHRHHHQQQLQQKQQQQKQIPQAERWLAQSANPQVAFSQYRCGTSTPFSRYEPEQRAAMDITAEQQLLTEQPPPPLPAPTFVAPMKTTNQPLPSPQASGEASARNFVATKSPYTNLIPSTLGGTHHIGAWHGTAFSNASPYAPQAPAFGLPTPTRAFIQSSTGFTNAGGGVRPPLLLPTPTRQFVRVPQKCSPAPTETLRTYSLDTVKNALPYRGRRHSDCVVTGPGLLFVNQGSSFGGSTPGCGSAGAKPGCPPGDPTGDAIPVTNKHPPVMIGVSNGATKPAAPSGIRMMGGTRQILLPVLSSGRMSPFKRSACS
eukprot:GEMP01009932.1.p1 GENE.GEMP01009932.1~~GEMP01009932.1.p1  ORF type:complete len:770 (+),score=193.22 GEMP01009932.1:85-2394(+)